MLSNCYTLTSTIGLFTNTNLFYHQNPQYSVILLQEKNQHSGLQILIYRGQKNTLPLILVDGMSNELHPASLIAKLPTIKWIQLKSHKILQIDNLPLREKLPTPVFVLTLILKDVVELESGAY